MNAAPGWRAQPGLDEGIQPSWRWSRLEADWRTGLATCPVHVRPGRKQVPTCTPKTEAAAKGSPTVQSHPPRGAPMRLSAKVEGGHAEESHHVTESTNQDPANVTTADVTTHGHGSPALCRAARSSLHARHTHGPRVCRATGREDTGVHRGQRCPTETGTGRGRPAGPP